ncbi:tryptophan synthase beta subunit-like PLP-dependent enzyme [Irpex rosettiformis]|uniref:Tryptophan synthase beta subunit-like PLP-dependent enzyme n=1 Tax=Irpex rosettiformis TaxID=378272 RepID=A0ACB8TU47_9APHY|nr:tryptophan synthase beta subunit-like PLP-dependent enzyme [Irpex rosettiformis]
MSSEPLKSLWLETPLIYSKHISAFLGANVYLKLDLLQPSYSFKYRGISRFIQLAIRTHGPSVHCIVASGGNAGLAAACAAKVLGLKCTVYLPAGAIPAILAFFAQEGAEVREVGKCYQEALAAAQDAVAAEENAVLVPAYEDPVIWDGHASVIEETARQLPQGVKPDAVVCCVGGGGLLGGIIVGCKSVGWDDVPIVGMETHGSNCFYQSISLNPGPFPSSPLPPREGVEIVHDSKYNVDVAKLSKLTSRASSLGASWPSPGVVKLALERKGGIKSVCVSDEMAMQTTLKFANDHKLLVELACAATLASAYNPSLFDKLVPPKTDTERTVVFIVCGGFKIFLEDLAEYRTILDAEERARSEWEVWCNGENWNVAKD